MMELPDALLCRMLLELSMTLKPAQLAGSVQVTIKFQVQHIAMAPAVVGAGLAGHGAARPAVCPRLRKRLRPPVALASAATRDLVREALHT